MMLDFNNLDTYKLLIEVTSKYEIDPSMSLEAEDYFRNLLSRYEGDHSSGEHISNWLDIQISEAFISLGERPRWIQAAEWPFFEGEPMIFVGQVDVPVSMESEFFHDDTSFYIFIPKQRKEEPKTIIQQF